LEDPEMRLSPKKTSYPEVEWQVLGQPAQSTSKYIVKSTREVGNEADEDQDP
jgi:hypothetical protein